MIAPAFSFLLTPRTMKNPDRVQLTGRSKALREGPHCHPEYRVAMAPVRCRRCLQSWWAFLQNFANLLCEMLCKMLCVAEGVARWVHTYHFCRAYLGAWCLFVSVGPGGVCCHSHFVNSSLCRRLDGGGLDIEGIRIVGQEHFLAKCWRQSEQVFVGGVHEAAAGFVDDQVRGGEPVD